MSAVKSGIRIATADGRWFVHRLHGVCYVSWVSAKDKAEAERFPAERSQQWLENLKEMTGMDDLKVVNDDHVDKPLPNPAYPCSVGYEEYSWPADELYWSDRLQNWYCDNCWDEMPEHWIGDGEVVKPGISLADELKRRGLSR